MNILELAVASGMQVTLDARIGMQEYQSVHGSLQALLRFADALLRVAPNAGQHEALTEAKGRTCSWSGDKREVRQ